MKKTVIWTALAAILLLFAACETEKPFEPLFNGENLDNWELFVGSPLRGFDSLALAATPEKLFSVTGDGDEKVIRISGEVNGSMATRASYADYHLKLIFRWGDSVYTSRNSGLLYHSFGDFGAAFGTWMTNIECQLMHGNLGDTYLMNNTVCETAALKDDSTGSFVFTPGADPLPFGAKANGNSVKKSADHEKPLGEWNTVELYSLGQTTVHVVNGVTVMVNTLTGTAGEDESVTPLTGGKIQIQSEGGELFVKSVEIRPITNIPAGILSQK